MLAEQTVLVPISASALRRRIDRALALRGEILRSASRNPVARKTVGARYTVDLKSGNVSRLNVTLEALARELGVLHSHEQPYF